MLHSSHCFYISQKYGWDKNGELSDHLPCRRGHRHLLAQFSGLSSGPPSMVLPPVWGKAVTRGRSLQGGPGNPRQAVLTQNASTTQTETLDNRNLETRPWEQALKKVCYVCIEPVPMRLGAHECHRLCPGTEQTGGSFAFS